MRKSARVKKVILLLVFFCFVSVVVTIIISIYKMKKSDGIEFVIGMSQANLYEPWRISMNREIVEEAKKYKNVKIVIKDAGGDTDKQQKDINELVESGIDLLIVSIDDSQKLTPEVSKVYKSIPVIVLDRAVEGYDYTLYIGSDNESIGRKAGDLVSDLIGNKQGKVVEVQGLLDSPPVIARSNGFKETIKDHPNIKIARTVIGEWQRDEAEDKLTDVLNEDKNIDVIFAHNDYMAIGAYKAASKLGYKNIKIIGIDGLTGENGGIDLVSKGILAGTFTCPTGGKEAVDYAVDILNKKEGIPKKIILRSDKITKENVNEYVENKQKVAAASKKIVLGYAQLKSESKWRDANAKSIKSAAEKAGIDLVFLESGTTMEDQKNLIRELIKRKVDIISFSPFVRTGYDDVLNEAKNAGIPVIICDRTVDSDDSLYVSNIGSDFLEEGRRAARLLHDYFQNKDVNIFEIKGNEGSTPTIEREEGFNEIIRNYQNYNIVASDTGNFKYEGGKAAMEKFLKHYGKIANVVYAQNDDMALGAIDACKEFGLKPGKDIIIIGTDATRQALSAVKRGEMYCTIECNALLGPQLMQTAKDVSKGIEVPLKIINSEDIFTSNVSNKEIRNREY